MSSNNAVNDAIAAAKAQAATAPKASTEVATVAAGNNAVAPYQPTTKLSHDDLDNGSLSVDGFVQSKFQGLSFKMQDEELTKGTTIVEEALVTLTFNDNVTVFRGMKYGNNPTIYIKTFENGDGAKEARSGKLWTAEVAKAKIADSQAYEYTGADIEMKVKEDIKDVKGKVVVPAGMSLGHSTTPTGLKGLKALRKAIEAAGLLDTEVVVKLTNTPQSKGGNDWGILTFQLVGENEITD